MIQEKESFQNYVVATERLSINAMRWMSESIMNGKTGILNETLLIRHDILQLSVSILIRRLFVLMKVSKKV